MKKRPRSSLKSKSLNKKPTSEKLLYWLQSMECNDAVVKQLDILRKEEEARQKRMRDYRDKIVFLTVRDVINEMVDSLNNVPVVVNNPSPKLHKNTKKRSVEMPWSHRASVIFFFLHPHMANKDLKATSDAFGGIPKETIRCWLHRSNMIPKWLPYIENMKASDVIDLLPEEVRQYFYGIPANSTVDLSDYIERTALLVEVNNTENKGKTKRISSTAKLGRRTAYPEQREWVINTIWSRWNAGDPLTKPELQKSLEYSQDFRNSESSFFKNILDPLSKCYPNSLHQFLSRTLKNGNFVVRSKNIFQQIPEDWRAVALEKTRQIREQMQEAGVEILIAADEIFVKFPSLSVDDTDGLSEYTDSVLIVVSLERGSSQLLPPFFLFPGPLEPQLVGSWKAFEFGTVEFAEECRMTTKTTIKYLENLIRTYPGKTIGVILDMESSHYSKEILLWVKQTNETSSSTLVLSFIEGGLTPVCHPTGVCLTKSLKQKLHAKFGHIRDSVPNPGPLKLLPHRISRERMTELLLECYFEINSSNRSVRSIAKAFEICGVDPWATDSELFTGNLNTLSTNSIYEMLLSNQAALKLV